MKQEKECRSINIAKRESRVSLLAELIPRVPGKFKKITEKLVYRYTKKQIIQWGSKIQN